MSRRIGQSAKPPQSILVHVGLDLVGDGLIKLPFVRALRAAFPEAHITWLAGKGRSVYAGILAPLVEGLLDEVVDEAGVGSHLTEILRSPLSHTRLAGRRFDLLIDTRRRVKTALVLRRIPHGTLISPAADFLLSDVRPARGYRRPAALSRQLLDLVELASGRPVEAVAPLAIDPAFESAAESLLPAGPRYVGLAPGAGTRQKCWPLDRYIALARELKQAAVTPVFLLGPGEADWVDEVRGQAPDVQLIALTQAALGEAPSPLLTIALGRRMSAAVANDSGAGHMLAAAGVPLLSLFGFTPAKKFAPHVSRGAILEARSFGPSDAMTEIPLEAVSQALMALIQEEAKPARS